MTDRFFIILTLCVGLLILFVVALIAILFFTPQKRAAYLDRLFKVCLGLAIMGAVVIFKLLLVPP